MDAASSSTGTSSAPAIRSASPPTMPITVAAAPNAANASRGPRRRTRPAPRRTARLRSGAGAHLGAVPAGDAALGQRHREPALGDVVHGAQRAGAHGLADRRVQRAQLAEVRRGELALAGASPRSLASSEPVSDGAQPAPAISAIASPGCAKPSRPARAASGSSPTMPTTGVGKIGPPPPSL